MVKYATNRKRSYKKRRMIRKLKRTMRRKIHMVGGVGPEEELIRLVIKMSPGILKLILGNIEPFVRICVLLAKITSAQMGGRSSMSSKLYQTGGALSQSMKDELNQKLSQLKQSFTEKQKMDVVACIEKIIGKVNTQAITPENIPVPNTPTIEEELTSEAAAPESAPTPTPDTESTSILAKLTEFKKVITDKVKQKIESKVTTLKSILNGDEYQCIQTIKTAVLEDFRERIENSSIMGSVRNAVSKGKDLVKDTAGTVLQSEIGKKAQNLMNNFSQSEITQNMKERTENTRGNLQRRLSSFFNQ